MSNEAFWAYLAGLVCVYLVGFLSGRSGARVVVIQAKHRVPDLRGTIICVQLRSNPTTAGPTP